MTHRDVDLTGKTVLITGSNSGIGKEAAVSLATMGARVILTSRDRAKGRAALDEVRHRSGRDDVLVGDLDLASLASVRRFADWALTEAPRIDVLVNNAGLMTGRRRVTADGFEEMFGVNHLGHFLLTNLLLDRLVASAPSRVVVVSSLAHRFTPRGLRRDDLQSERRFWALSAYSRSKLANALFAVELARRLQGTGVTVNAMHPGTVASNFGGEGDTRFLGSVIGSAGRLVMRTPESGARAIVRLASSPEPAVADTTGAYYSAKFRSRASRAARSRDHARWLWEVSEELVGAVPSEEAAP